MLRIKEIKGKQYVLCDWRKRWVRLTPEEWVRQHFLHKLVDSYGYPFSRIGVEVPIEVGAFKKRCDAIVYDAFLRPLVLIECKADTVALSQRTFDQAITYNYTLRVPFLFLHNGQHTIIAQMPSDFSDTDSSLPKPSVRPIFLNDIPSWSQLSCLTI